MATKDRIAALGRLRVRLKHDYDKAARIHRGQAKAAGKLREATHRQLAAELDLMKARPLKRHQAARRAHEPDMFAGAAE